MRRSTPWRPGCFAAAVVLLLLHATPGRAGLIPVVIAADAPAVQSFFGVLTYNSVTGLFHSETDALAYVNLGLPDTFGSMTGTVIVDLKVDQKGNFVATGSGLKITGGIDLNNDGTDDLTGDNATPLLFGAITAFGAAPAGPPTVDFNGLFSIDGGLLTGDLALPGGGTVPGGFPVGSTGAFFLSAENVTTGTLGDFTAHFASDGTKSVVVAATPVPAPPSWVLALTGAASAAGFGVFRRKVTPR